MTKQKAPLPSGNIVRVPPSPPPPRAESQHWIGRFEPLLQQTDEIREELIENIRELLNIAIAKGRRARKSKSESAYSNWVRIAGYLSQCINALLTNLDMGRIQADIEKVRKFHEEEIELARREVEATPGLAIKRAKSDSGR